MLCRQVIVILTVTTLISLCSGAHIVSILAFPSKSFVVLGSALLKELAKHGHNVTMISAFPHDRSIPNYSDVYLDDVDEVASKFFKTVTEVPPYKRPLLFLNGLDQVFTKSLENKNFIKFMKNTKKVDLVIILSSLHEVFLGIGHKFGAPTIGFNVIANNPLFSYSSRAPMPFSYMPVPFLPFTDDMTFLQRVTNTIASSIVQALLHFVNMPYQAKLLKKYFPEAPPLEELADNLDLFLVNSHYGTDIVGPVMPNTIQIGGFHLFEDLEPLPKDLKEFLDNSENGFIFVSFGSNIRSDALDANLLNTLIIAFSKLKMNVLWKYDDQLKEELINVKTSKWLPQRSILAHPKIKAFVTHAGMGSVAETIFHGVPMVCLPFRGDQLGNTAKSVRNGYAIKLDINKLTEHELLEAINEVSNNPIYKENIMKKSMVYREQEINPMDKAVFWIEHVLKHKGAKHLKSRSTKIPLYQYLLLDVIGFLLLIALIIFLIMYIVIKLVMQLICRTLGKCFGRKKVKTN